MPLIHTQLVDRIAKNVKVDNCCPAPTCKTGSKMKETAGKTNHKPNHSPVMIRSTTLTRLYFLSRPLYEAVMGASRFGVVLFIMALNQTNKLVPNSRLLDVILTMIYRPTHLVSAVIKKFVYTWRRTRIDALYTRA